MVANVTKSLAALVEEEVAEKAASILKASHKTILFSLTGSKLQSVAHSGEKPDTLRHELANSFSEAGFAAHVEGIPWEIFSFFEPLPSDHDIFRVYVLVHKPGAREALIESCVEKIRLEMSRFDLNEPPETIEFRPLSFLSLIYSPRVASIHLNSTVNSISARLQADRIFITNRGNDVFECERF